MDSRADSFAQRFEAARPHLKAQSIYDLVSLKYRGRRDVPDSDYSQLVDYLKRHRGLDMAPVEGRFGGRGS